MRDNKLLRKWKKVIPKQISEKGKKWLMIDLVKISFTECTYVGHGLHITLNFKNIYLKNISACLCFFSFVFEMRKK